MDTSKKYIYMCRMAGEIQKVWKPKFGDYCFGKVVSECHGSTEDTPSLYRFDTSDGDCWHQSIPVGYGYDDGGFDGETDSVWLPQQDQLQSLLEGSEWSTINQSKQIGALQCFAEDYPKNSYEKLWLCFVMKTLYNKKWDFETQDWVDLA